MSQCWRVKVQITPCVNASHPRGLIIVNFTPTLEGLHICSYPSDSWDSRERIGLQQKWGIYPFIESENKNKIELKLKSYSIKKHVLQGECPYGKVAQWRPSGHGFNPYIPQWHLLVIKRYVLPLG